MASFIVGRSIQLPRASGPRISRRAQSARFRYKMHSKRRTSARAIIPVSIIELYFLGNTSASHRRVRSLARAVTFRSIRCNRPGNYPRREYDQYPE